MFGLKVGDKVKLPNNQEGIISRQYIFGAYYLVDMMENGERNGLTNVYHYNEIIKIGSDK